MTTAQPSPKTLTEDNTRRLFEHFSGDGPSANERWSALWDAGDFLPWDQGFPNPALVDVMRDRKDLVGAALVEENGKVRRKRALVPGCGRGYDVLFLSSLGFDAYGLEVSTKAVGDANAWANEHSDDYPVQDETVGRGEIRFIHGDFFRDNWLDKLEGVRRFELIYDYTFFCALSPAMRPSWALRYSQLLSSHPSSVLICVEFPVYKDLSLGGPPYGVPSAVYEAHLAHPGVEISYDTIEDMGDTKDGKAVGFQRIDHWKAVRTHEMGKDKDWVSVWKRCG